jgi:hypothetical protein
MITNINIRKKGHFLIRRAATLHRTFISSAASGPELYFHLRCLQFWQKMDDGLVTRGHAECLYALLVAWGMNSRKARMEPFEHFFRSLRANRKLIAKLSRRSLLKVRDADWRRLRPLWDTLVVTNTNSSYQLVGRSKVVAHLMPQWLAPIDRAHTLKFLTKSTSITSSHESQWILFREIHEKLFLPVAKMKAQQLRTWVDSASAYGWDSSIPKTIDNLIWGHFQHQKHRRKKKK